MPSSFWSTEVVEQAHIVDCLAFAATYIGPGLSKARAIRAFNWPANASEETVREAKSRPVKSLEILEEGLEKREWLALERPTIADIAGVSVRWVGLDGESFAAVICEGKGMARQVRGLEGFLKPDAMDKNFQR